MGLTLNLPNPPAEYDRRDQAETRRLIQSALAQFSVPESSGGGGTDLTGYAQLAANQTFTGINTFTQGIWLGTSPRANLSRYLVSDYILLAGPGSSNPAELYIGSRADPSMYARADVFTWQARDGSYNNAYVSNAEIAPSSDNTMGLGTQSLAWTRLFCGRGFFKNYGSDPSSGKWMRVRHDNNWGYLESYDYGGAAFTPSFFRASEFVFQVGGSGDAWHIGPSITTTSLGFSSLHGTASRFDIGVASGSFPGIYGASTGAVVLNSDRFALYDKGISNAWMAVDGARFSLGTSANYNMQMTGDYTLLYGPSSTNPCKIYIGSNGDPSIYMDTGNATSSIIYRNSAGNVRAQLTLASSPTFAMNGTQILRERITGWNAPTGTLTRGTFAVSGATTASTAQALAALLTDLRSHGLIGT